MKLLKQLTGLLKQLAPGIPPWVFLLVLALIPLVILAVKAIKKKKKAAKPEADAGGAVEPTASRPVAAAKVPKDRYTSAWQRFLDGLPRTYRRSIGNFQPFVVMGAAGSGKSKLIDTYTDWRRQSNQFLSSYVEDPNLQVYLASNALMLELPPAALYDTSPSGREALDALWRPLFKNTTPVVVIPVDLPGLTMSPPDVVRDLADTIRGKVNLLSEIRGRPIEVRIALTNLATIEGFTEFTHFAERKRVPTDLRLGQPGPDYVLEGQIRQTFADLGKYLPLALTTVQSEDYLRIVAFLRDAQTHLDGLVGFIEALVQPSTLSERPHIERVYLTSVEATEGISSPFVTSANLANQATPPAIARHRIIAASAAGAVFLYFGLSYLHERSLWEDAQTAYVQYPNALTKLATKSSPERERVLRPPILRFLDEEARGSLRRFTPGFFDHAAHEMSRGLARAMREDLFALEVERSFTTAWPYRRSLYYFALLYAAEGNSLHRLVSGNLNGWAHATTLDRDLLATYMSVAVNPNPVAPKLDGVPARISDAPSNQIGPWVDFFRTLSIALSAESVPLADLESLQADAGRLLASLAEVKRYGHANDILESLTDSTPHDFQEAYRPFLDGARPARVFGGNTERVKRLLQIVDSSTVAHPPPISRSLASLTTRLDPMVAHPELGPYEHFFFNIEEQQFVFDVRSWMDLVRNSVVAAEVRAFIAQRATSPGGIFFTSSDHFEDILMNPRNDGEFLFTGNTNLPGRYTRRAFDAKVRPALREVTEIVRALRPILRTEAEDLDRFIRGETDRYARSYLGATLAYWDELGVRAASADLLQVALTAMLREVSPFSDMLSVTSRQLALDLELGEVPYYEVVQLVLKPYEVIPRITTKDASGSAEVDIYYELLRQLLADLQAGAAPAKGAKGAGGAAPATAGFGGAQPAEAKAPAEGAPASGLTERLTASGRMGLDIFQETEASKIRQLRAWFSSVGLPERLWGPFEAPFTELQVIGLKEISSVVDDVWKKDLYPSIREVARRYPFEKSSKEEATTAQINAAFHPQTGTFAKLRHAYLDPITVEDSGTIARRARALGLPSGMLETMNRVVDLQRTLWDEEMKAKTIRIPIAGVPFERLDRRVHVLTLVYLGSGASSVVNFNQKRAMGTIEIDWTQLNRSQLSIELTDPATGQKTYPEHMTVESTPWSFLRLLERGESSNGVWTWTFRHGPRSELVTRVQFSIPSDPWAPFRIEGTGEAGARAASFGRYTP